MRLRYFITLLLLTFAIGANAQFKTTGNITGGVPGSGRSGTSVNPESTVEAGSTALFSIKDYFRGLAGKDSISLTTLTIGSAVAVGGAQIYNKDYWKLPIIYGGIGSGLYFGFDFNKKYKATQEKKYKTFSTLSFAGAGLFYWGSLLDGMLSYESDLWPDPAKSTIASVLLPGLGQIYNKDYWKIPIWYTGFMFCGYFWNYNSIQYERFKYIYKLAGTPGSGYVGTISTDTAVYYRDLYRRYRDYSIVATIAVYLLQVIDANVFAYMSDFEVTDDLSVNVQPSLIPTLQPTQLATNNFPVYNPSTAVGLQMSFNF